MGFLDVYGLSEDSAMEGVETEQDDLGERRGDGFGHNPIELDSAERNHHGDQVDESGDINMDGELRPRLDKGKGKEVPDFQSPLEHHDIDAVRMSSTTAAGSNSNVSSHPIQIAPSLAASASQPPFDQQNISDGAGACMTTVSGSNTLPQHIHQLPAPATE